MQLKALQIQQRGNPRQYDGPDQNLDLFKTTWSCWKFPDQFKSENGFSLPHMVD